MAALFFVSFKAILVVLALFSGLAKGNCPVHGCTPVCSYASQVQYASKSSKPRLAWSYDLDKDMIPSSGCVTNGYRIICSATSTSSNEAASYLFSWGTAHTDGGPWNASFKGNVVLPAVDYSGGFIASDGLVLEGFDSTGVPFGDPVVLYPTHGELFDLSIAASKVILLYKCGFLATYITNGIPHAGIWLNDTLDGETGTFIPLADPATHGNNRFYVLTAFRPHSQPTLSSDLKLRLFAIDLFDSAVFRISIAWHYDFTIANLKLPYLETSETFCTEQSLGSAPIGRNSFAQVAISENFVTILFRYREPEVFVDPNQYNHSRMLIIEDQGKSFTGRFSGDTENAFQALAFYTNVSYWTAFYYIRTKQSMLQQHMFPRGEMTGEIDISKLLNVGDKQVNITSDITFLQMDSYSPLVFCVLVNNVDSKLLAVDVVSEKLLWSVDLGTELCTGQISSIDGASQNSFLVLTTSSQLLVYNLT